MAVGSRSESLIFTLTFVKKKKKKMAVLQHSFTFYVLAAQFIYSRRDKPVVEPVEGYGYEDLTESSNSLLNHQLSEIDQGIVKSYVSYLKMINTQYTRVYQFYDSS